MRKVVVCIWGLLVGVAVIPGKGGYNQDLRKFKRKQSRSEVYRIVMSSTSLFCRGARLPDYESYYVSAESQGEVACRLIFTDMDKMMVRVGAPLAPAEEIHLYGYGFNVTLTNESPLYGCYLLYGVTTVQYRKQANTRPSVNMVITNAECDDYDRDCDQPCRADACKKPLPIHGCNKVCIDDDLVCDGYQQCPYGEDERCGQITTVTPMPDHDTSPTTVPSETTTTSLVTTSTMSSSDITTTTASSTITTLFPPHILAINVGPQSDGCNSNPALYRNQEVVITGPHNAFWTGKCSYTFLSGSRRADSKELAVVRFEGGLSSAEKITLRGFNGEFFIDGRTHKGECFMISGNFDVSYEVNGETKSEWRLVSTPIDCDTDQGCGQLCRINRCHQGNEQVCTEHGCIKAIDVCDGVQQCPFGEDESCGGVTTVIPPRKRLSGGEIFLIVLAVAVVVASVLGMAFYLMKKPRERAGGFTMAPVEPEQSPTRASLEENLEAERGKKESSDRENLYETG